jgi:TatD DNase family protein
MVIDSHCHLHDPAFADLKETLRRSMAHDVWGAIAVGCDAETNAQTLEAAAAAPKSVWACLGFHPDRTQLTDEDLERVEAQIATHHSRIVGIGEIGLPWYSLEGAPDPASLRAQGRARLDRLLGLAIRWNLPVALHAPHEAAADALAALKRHGIERAVFHWHKAPAAVTRAIIDAGYLVSVTPDVISRNRDRDLVTGVPLDALLVESDGPWPYGGEFEGLDSGPWLASRVAEEVAKLKRLPIEDVMYQLSTNACRLFDLMWA